MPAQGLVDAREKFSSRAPLCRDTSSIPLQVAGTKPGFRAYWNRGRKRTAGKPSLEARSKMRFTFVALAGLMLFAGHSAQAKVDITVDKNSQMMTVAVDGV